MTQKFFVKSIELFSSVARGDFSTYSDIDIVVDFSKPVGEAFIDLGDYIETIKSLHGLYKSCRANKTVSG